MLHMLNVTHTHTNYKLTNKGVQWSLCEIFRLTKFLKENLNTFDYLKKEKDLKFCKKF